MPNSASRRRQTEPAATRAAVSRAEARSRAGLRSVYPYFNRPGQVGVTGPGVGEGRDRLAAPLNVVAVYDQQRYRRAGGFPFHHTAEDLGGVGLDFHPRARAVAVLAPGQVAVDPGGLERQAGGKPVQDGG